MYKVAILDTNALTNKGSYGRLVGLLAALNVTLPKCEITIFHRFFDMTTIETLEGLKKWHSQIKIKKHPWYNQKKTNLFTAVSFLFWFPFYTIRVVAEKKKSPFNDFDVIIDLNFIEPYIFNDKKIDIVSFVGQLFSILSIWNSTLSHKKVVICSATICPYYNSLLKFLAKRVLNDVQLITLREEFSRDCLISIGIDKPKVQVTADLAFLMETKDDFEYNKCLIPNNEDREQNIIVGICPAAMMNLNLDEFEYIKIISEVSNFFIEDKNATILLIAHTFQDILLVEKIYQEINNPKKTRIIPFRTSPSDIKIVIRNCNLFISSRFHALVASTSMGTPSIGLVSYSSIKFHGIIGRMMKQEEFLLDINSDFNYKSFLNEIKLKSDYLLNHEEGVRSALLTQARLIKQEALLNGLLIRDLISQTNSEGN